MDTPPHMHAICQGHVALCVVVAKVTFVVTHHRELSHRQVLLALAVDFDVTFEVALVTFAIRVVRCKQCFRGINVAHARRHCARRTWTGYFQKAQSSEYVADEG